jgi:hypothetical protein
VGFFEISEDCLKWGPLLIAVIHVLTNNFKVLEHKGNFLLGNRVSRFGHAFDNIIELGKVCPDKAPGLFVELNQVNLNFECKSDFLLLELID